MPEVSLPRLSVIALLVCLAVVGGSAQEEGERSPWSVVRDDAGQVLTDAASIFSAPAHWDGGDALRFGLTVAGTGALMTADRSVRDLALRNGSPFGDRLADVGREYGTDLNALALSAVVYGGGLLGGSTAVRRTGMEMGEAVLFAGAIGLVAKTAIGRSRPSAEEGPWMFRPFRFDVEAPSLPSGHTTVAFAVSSVLAARLKNTYATIGFYSLAAVTAYARVYEDQHWLADTFAGAVLGTAVGWSVVALHGEGDTRLSLLPTTRGVRAELRF